MLKLEENGGGATQKDNVLMHIPEIDIVFFVFFYIPIRSLYTCQRSLFLKKTFTNFLFMFNKFSRYNRGRRLGGPTRFPHII